MSFLSNAIYEGVQTPDLSGVPLSSTSYSLAGWIKPTGSVTDAASNVNLLLGICRHDFANGHAIVCGTTFNNVVRLRESTNVTGFTNPGDLTSGAWLYVALTCGGTGSTDLKGYIWNASGTLIMSQSRTGSAITAPNYAHFGGASNGAQIVHQYSAYGRLWSSVLSQAQLETELASATPVKTDTILTAFAADSITDVTGNSRNWTQRTGTTLDTGDNPTFQSGSHLILPHRSSGGMIDLSGNFRG